MAEIVGDELVVIQSLNIKVTSIYVNGNPEGRRLLEESRRRADQAGNPWEETRALYNLAAAAGWNRELKLASEMAQQAIGIADRHELRALENYASAVYTEVLCWQGDWGAAEDLCAAILESDPGRNHLPQLIAGRVLGRLQARRGVPGARGTLERSWASTEENAAMRHLLPAGAAQAEYMWLTGEHDGDLLSRFGSLLEEGIQLAGPWASGDLAFWLWKLDALNEAPDGIAEPYRMMIEGGPIEAAAVWESMGLAYDRALALMHGDDGARLQALEQFETTGATAVAAKFRQILREEGVSVPRGRSQSTRDHAAGLTARQAEILELLGHGSSNIEIADRLFVSPRTVEHHVAAVMSKLDASSRDDAVAKAVDQGLLSA